MICPLCGGDQTRDAEKMCFGHDWEKVYVGLKAERDRFHSELENIANADTSTWDDPSDFKAWAQNRARHAIRK